MTRTLRLIAGSIPSFVLVPMLAACHPSRAENAASAARLRDCPESDAGASANAQRPTTDAAPPPLADAETATDTGDAGPSCSDGTDCLTKGADARARADWMSAIRYFEQACELGASGGCTSWAGLLCVGVDPLIARDERRCMELTQTACEMGDRNACRSVGNLYRQGSRDSVSFPRDLGRAFQIYQTNCRAGDGASCAQLAYCYRDGAGTTLNSKLAKQYRWMAEELGFVGE